MRVPDVNIPLPSLSPSKDPSDDPRFRKGFVLRWFWRTYTQRFTPAGRWFALASGAIISYSGTSLHMQGYIPGAYLGALWLLAVTAMLLYRPKVKVTATLPDRIAAGSTATAQLKITNLSRLRGGDLAILFHKLPLAIEPVETFGKTLPDLAKNQTVETTLTLSAPRRGQYILNGFRVESGFPFGILRSRQTFHEPHKLLVYPRFTPLSYLSLPTGRRYQPGGVAMASQIGESFEYRGNREYREGDNIRDIDWRATARVGTPIVREWVEEYMLRVAVVLDTQLPSEKGTPKRELEARKQDFERAISVAASVSDYMARNDYLVDLFAAGPDLYHLTAGRSLAYLDQILDILTAVEPGPANGFVKIEPDLAALLDRLSTVILILLDHDEPRRQFAETLRAQGVAVKVILVRSASPTLPDLQLPHLESDDLGPLTEGK